MALHSGYRDKIRINSATPDRIVFHFLQNFPILSIQFNCSDTTLRVTEPMKARQIKIFVLRHLSFLSRIWRRNSTYRIPSILTHSHTNSSILQLKKTPKASITHLQTRSIKNEHKPNDKLYPFSADF